MFLRRRRRLIVLFATFALVFQQLAMAAYVCAREAAAQMSPVAPACHTDVDTDRSRCHEHCHPTSATADHGSAPTVPPCLVPAHVRIVAASLPINATSTSNASFHRWATAPPLNVQYCTRQI